MRIIDTEITDEILNRKELPQIKIGSRVYEVDNRKSIYDQIQQLTNQEGLSETEREFKIYELALGTQAAQEIQAMDLPFDKAIYLSFCVMGAITGEDPKELQKAAKEQRKN